MAEITLVEAIRQAMDEEMARDERVFIVGEDVGKRGGVFRATVGLFEKYGEERVIDSPLAELSIVGVGIGAALYDMRPICEIQFADFIYPAFNQIVSEAAKMCYRSNGEWTVPLVIRAPYGGGIGGGLASVISPAKLQNAAASIDRIGEEGRVVPAAIAIAMAITAVCAGLALLWAF
jgi:2-oxoisovalerate dehydrogenase E1 component beta subunit